MLLHAAVSLRIEKNTGWREKEGWEEEEEEEEGEGEEKCM